MLYFIIYIAYYFSWINENIIMKKILLVLSLVLLISSCWNDSEEKNEIKPEVKKVEAKIEQKFGTLNKYIKTDINDEETKQLTELLEKRDLVLAEIKKIIEEVTLGNKDIAIKNIEEKFNGLNLEIIKYVSNKKDETFVKYNKFVISKIKEKINKEVPTIKEIEVKTK